MGTSPCLSANLTILHSERPKLYGPSECNRVKKGNSNHNFIFFPGQQSSFILGPYLNGVNLLCSERSKFFPLRDDPR